ncbi:MAG: S8/S53 family peptidase, partial [Flavobacteriales bacterium]|nr:S8/S53 family peptidase [Flavobacteriales bacterium]
YTLLLAVVLLMTACKKEELSQETQGTTIDLRLNAPLPQHPENVASLEQINAAALEQLQSEGVVKWEKMDDALVWSALLRSDSLLSVGYQALGHQDIENNIHLIDVNSAKWKGVKDALQAHILSEAQRLNPNMRLEKEDLFAFGDKELPYFNVKVWNFEILAQLRRMDNVRYAEPMGYGTQDEQRSDAGCGSNGPDWGIPSSDYSVVAPNAKVSWNYEYSNIQNAWASSTGDNITIGLIDTGVNSGQANLNGSFASGQSTGRFCDKLGFHESCWWWWCSNDGVWDDCGHGTSMAGTIAGPRTSTGSTVGVAYNANLVSCRGTDDVVINGSREKDGVTDSFYYLGNRSDVKIISMSLGDVFWSSQVADGVYYAYNRGKLIFCAAGTSLSWTSWWGVIFPANMSQTTAVTGIRTGSPMQRCVECHSGSQVD